MQDGSAVEGAPQLGRRNVALDYERDHLADVGQRLMHGDALDAFDSQRSAQEIEEQRLHADALDETRFARRHLRDDRGEDGVAPSRDAGDVHIGVEFLQVDVAVGFPERRFGFQIFGVDKAFDHDLGFRRHQEIDGLGLHHVDGRADERAGHVKLVNGLGQLLHRGEGDAGRRAEHHRAGQFLDAALAQLFPVIIDARSQLQRGVHAEPARRLHVAAIVAEILDAGVGILGDVLRQRRIGRDVPAGRRDRQRNAVEPVAGLVQRLAGDHDVMAWRLIDNARRDRVRRRLDPALVDFVKAAADADAIDFPVRGEHADRDRNVVFALFAVDHVGEQESLAIPLLDAAAELPAHQRVHFGVLVDRPVDGDEQVGLIERLDVIVQVRIAARRNGVRGGRDRFTFRLGGRIHGEFSSDLARRRVGKIAYRGDSDTQSR